MARSCARGGAKTQQPPPTPKAWEKRHRRRTAVCGRAISLALVQVPSGPLAKEMQKACQTEIGANGTGAA
ncbi:hypothetical protein FHX14_004647 [Rhizobium sp. BK619]|uniref:Uncharacterized protein n=1 Tax=Rhizobium leguminosarum TaxID=384 RepID=A0A7W9ZNV8_RHILE|nr:hypothetical protein [Rhizobium sp. BK619]MBB6220130.1 hypothetical protein [Rhizobium leguminosarum]